MSKVVINEVTIGDGSEFENRKIQCTINGKKHMVHATRFISSYFKAIKYENLEDEKIINIVDWLESIGVSDDDIYTISHLATNGKDELEESAREFLQK